MISLEKAEGSLLGTALGDALGVPLEGLSPRGIRWLTGGKLGRFFPLGVGVVSDDTEQTVLVTQSIASHPGDPDACVRAFRRSLGFWFLRLPWGIGLATLRACVRILLGVDRSGVRSAGNGAAMRAAMVGVVYVDQAEYRRSLSRQLAEVTHTDPRGVQGAVFVSEVASLCCETPALADVVARLDGALGLVDEPILREALERARGLAAHGSSTEEAAEALGTTGYVVHTVPFALFCLVRFGGDPVQAITEAVRAGGDTDSTAAIVGAWVGALHGSGSLPAELINRIHDGPFGPTHLRKLAKALVTASPPPSYSWVLALLRNVLLGPIIMAMAVVLTLLDRGTAWFRRA